MDTSYRQSILDTAQQAALDAGGLLRQRFRSDFRVSKKGPIDFVTEMDVKAEELILGRVREAFPDHGILAEEAGANSHHSAFNWLIDPLDGTTNYAHGIPAFCVSIAVEHEGRLDTGVIYDPTADELFSAQRGGGAFLNGAPVRVSEQGQLQESLLGTGFSYDAEALRLNLRLFEEFMTRAAGVRRVGCAARDLSYVACGRLDAVWEFYLKPWDVAAGMLLIEEAGGRVTDFQGRPCEPRDKRILLSNGRLHDSMLEVLRDF
ncbi:MAG: inositol monophosphatase [Acidobacteria bacterium]|nr:MAG: inositol monophosphatase [Acidobacteriota bacterium]